MVYASVPTCLRLVEPIAVNGTDVQVSEWLQLHCCCICDGGAGVADPQRSSMASESACSFCWTLVQFGSWPVEVVAEVSNRVRASSSVLAMTEHRVRSPVYG